MAHPQDTATAEGTRATGPHCLPRFPCRSTSHAPIDWGKMAEQWLQEKEAERRKQKQRLTPRPSPSPMIESTPMSVAGDATPLLDEMDR